MLNSRSFTQCPSASTIVCMTFLLFTIGGCSAAKPPETLSPTANSVASEKTSSITSRRGVEETSPSPSDLGTNEASPAPIDITTESTLAKAEQGQEIPEPFHGVWNSNLEQCGSQAGDTRLVIDSQRIQFHESEGLFQDISIDGERNLTGKVELSGEGETWLSDIDFQLSDDQKTLTLSIDGSRSVRYRCSKADDLAKTEQGQKIPKPFQGEWNSNLEQCGSQAGDTRLVIDAQRIQFHESQGLIQDIATDGERKLTGKIELSGEGETWLSDIDFQLSDDQQALTAITDGSSFVRYRCS